MKCVIIDTLIYTAWINEQFIIENYEEVDSYPTFDGNWSPSLTIISLTWPSPSLTVTASVLKRYVASKKEHKVHLSLVQELENTIVEI